MHRFRSVSTLALIMAVTSPLVARAQLWTPPPPAADATAEVKTALQETDTLYAARDQGNNSTRALQILRSLGAKYPTSYDVQWRLAQMLFWVAEGTKDKDRHRALGQEGWDAGKRAIEARPDGPEGLFFKAICVGEVAHSVGIFTALRLGLESEFRDPLMKALKINPRVGNGGVYRALGRYKYELPWPKRDLDKSEKYLRRALALNPKDLRARLYLVDTLAKRDDGNDVEEAKQLLKEVLDAPIGADPPDERRMKEWARKDAARLEWSIQ